jgi:hypothetical protein
VSASGEKLRSAAAVTTCILVGIFLLWSTWWIWSFRNEQANPDPQQVRANERLAFRRLMTIAAAQKRYRAADWDGDGRRTYAAFLAHLWTTLDSDGDPVRADLIPRRLAFAMERPRAIDGYFYVDLRWKQTDRHQKRLLDWEREWAVAALPRKHGVTGRLVMLIDESGQVFVKDHNTMRFFLYPSHPVLFGWRRAASAAELVKVGKDESKAN